MALTVVVAACGDDDDSASSATTAAAPATTEAAATPATTAAEASGSASATGAGDSILDGAIPCEQQYAGKKVEILSPARNNENDPTVEQDYIDAYQPLMDCTGVEITWSGTDQFETATNVVPSLENDVVGAHLLERPPEHSPVEVLGSIQIRHLPLDMANRVRAHASSLSKMV